MAQRPGAFPESQVATALSFFRHVKSSLSDPAVYQEFLFLLRAFSTRESLDPRAVKDRVYALLRGHPELVRRLDEFLTAAEPARQDPAPTRPKRERRPAPAAAAAAAVDVDAGTRKALRYFERVSRRRAGLYDRLLALISDAEFEETTDLNQIYRRAVKIFGSDIDLLSEFVEYLPIPTGRERVLLLKRRGKEPQPEEHRAEAPKRKVITGGNPSAAKRPRVDDRKTTNRRAYSTAAVDADPKVSAFREAWEFETTYSKMVATAKRTKELLKQYEPSEGVPPPPRGHRPLEELFPSRECQDVLMEMYHGFLGPIREALEDGARTELALKTIKRRLKKLEQLAVKITMERRDPSRVEGRMRKLAVDRVLFLRKNQAKQSANT